MGSDWDVFNERVEGSDTLTPSPSPEGRGELNTTPKASEATVSLSLWERVGVRVLECCTYLKKATQKLDAVIRENLGVLGYGE